MGRRSKELSFAFQGFMSFLCKPEAADPGNVLGKALEVGAVNLKTMATLEDAHTSRYVSNYLVTRAYYVYLIAT